MSMMEKQAASEQDGSDAASAASRIADLAVATVADILAPYAPERLVLRGIRPVTPLSSTIAGPARTVRCLPVRHDMPRSPDGPVTVRTIEAMRPGEILVIDAMGFAEGAVLGDMMAFLASLRKAAGVVVDGAVRDIAGIEATKLKVFARATHPVSGMRRVTPWQADVPVQCGGALVLPGDWIVADREAAMVVPRGLLSLLLAGIEPARDDEKFTQLLIERGFPFEKVHPLPSALKPHLAEFRRDGRLPSSADIEATLSVR